MKLSGTETIIVLAVALTLVSAACGGSPPPPNLTVWTSDADCDARHSGYGGG